VRFFFAEHVLDADRRELHQGDKSVAVEPQVFDLLLCLVQNRDRVVSKDDQFATVWNGRIVSDSTLMSRVNAARKAIGDSGSTQKLIKTIVRKGFRFVGDVREFPNGEGPHPVALGDGAMRQFSPFSPSTERTAIGDSETARTALQALRFAQPNVSLAWIAREMPIKQGDEREHYVEGFRRAGMR
jgi:DNA-binding winged helix-turn-helix (wHTH) protein